jgi:hypothetical protein
LRDGSTSRNRTTKAFTRCSKLTQLKFRGSFLGTLKRKMISLALPLSRCPTARQKLNGILSRSMPPLFLTPNDSPDLPRHRVDLQATGGLFYEPQRWPEALGTFSSDLGFGIVVRRQ